MDHLSKIEKVILIVGLIGFTILIVAVFTSNNLTNFSTF